jgi:hypothetical protein
MTTTAPVRLRAAGLRVTRPRTATLTVLDDAQARHEHLAVADVVERARAVLGMVNWSSLLISLYAWSAEIICVNYLIKHQYISFVFYFLIL